MKRLKQAGVKLGADRAYTLSLAAVLLYNNWLLALVLNPHGTWAGATTSELGATDQPWSWLFRSLDVASGLLFLLGAAAVFRLAVTKVTRNILLLTVAALGLSTIVESLLLPLRCSSALSRVCEQQEKLGIVGWKHEFHIIESLVSYFLIWLLPVTVLAIVRNRPAGRKLKAWSWGLVFFMIIWGIETAFKYSHGTASYGYEQRLFVVIFSIWYWQAIRAGRHRSLPKSG